MNIIIAVGRMTRDAEVKDVGEYKKTTFSIACPRDRKVKGESGEWVPVTDFLDCEVWGREGEYVAAYAHKGDQLIVRGELHIEKYTKRDGSTGTSVVVNVQKVDIGARKSGTTESQEQGAKKPKLKPIEEDYPEDLPF